MLTLRTILAVFLIAGFFLLALGLAALLIWIPYYSWVYIGVINVKGGALCVFAALLILSTIWPRREVFLPPGPQLTEDRHPRLFERIRACAKATNSEMPRAVYLVPQLNAWVSRRGGFLLRGGEPILGLGAPLLAILTTSQLTAVLVHEFGHEAGGDVRFGGWIYGTRIKLLRAAGEFGSLRDHWLSVLKFPFLLYSRLFVGVTAAVSRHQELRADELSGRIAGSSAAISALRAIHAGDPAYERFLAADFGPLLERGFRPPLVEGFRTFFGRLSPEKDFPELLKAAEAAAGRSKDDTHPPLHVRVERLQTLPDAPKSAEDSPAIDLLDWDPTFEKDIVARMSNHTVARRATPISWQELGTDAGCCRVFLSEREQLYKSTAPGLRGITPLHLAELAKDPEAFGRRLTPQKMFSQAYAGLASAAIGTGLLLALRARGWTLKREPGRALLVCKGDHAVEADALLPHLRDGRISADEWAQRCRDYGIADVDLGGIG